MKHRNQMKRTYSSPLSTPTEVAFEQALLVGTGRLMTEVDEHEHLFSTMKADGTPQEDEPLYFEF